MTVGFFTLGCKLNQSETEALAMDAERKGFSVSGAGEPADIFIINTCAVTAKSEQKARRAIRLTAGNHPASLVIVTGCYARFEAMPLSSLAPNIIVVPQEHKASIADLFTALADRFSHSGRESRSPGCVSAPPDTAAMKAMCTAILDASSRVPDQPADCARPESADGNVIRTTTRSKPGKKNSGVTRKRLPVLMDNYRFHARAFVRIQDGCDCRCAYCIVPLARGGSLSEDADEILAAVRKVEEAGYGEIVITGVNISAYRQGALGLAGLLERICATAMRTRVRLSSLEPDAITDTLLAVLGSNAICPHFHIPVQSGSDRILRLMNRRYNSARLTETVTSLRTIRPGCFLGCDVIVGFPGETEEDFRQTVSILERLAFSAIHVFQFSPRPNTAAWNMGNRVPERVKKERAGVLLALSKRFTSTYVRAWIGKNAVAVLEKNFSEGGSTLWSGVTENYLKVRISGVPPEAARRGALAHVVLTGTQADARTGGDDEENAGEIISARYYGMMP